MEESRLSGLLKTIMPCESHTTNSKAIPRMPLQALHDIMLFLCEAGEGPLALSDAVNQSQRHTMGTYFL